MKTILCTVTTLLVAVSAVALTPGTDLFVPAVAHINGVDVSGVVSQWRTDLWIYNASTSDAASVSVALLVRGRANPNPLVRSLTINPGETRYLPDIVLATFGADATSGGLHVTASMPVAVTGVNFDANVRVVNKGQGSAGQFFSATSADVAIAAGTTTDLVGLDQDGVGTTGAWRTNLALVETTGAPVDLSIQRIDSLGAAVAAIPYHLDAFEADQINNVLSVIGGGVGTNQRVRISVTGGNGRVITSASRINNASGDPSTVEMIGANLSGQFQAVLLSNERTVLEGGLQFAIGNGILASFSGVAVVPCGDSNFTVPFSGEATSKPQPLNPDGTFSALASIPYTDGSGVVFTTVWTLSGARGADGTWSGTLLSSTTGGHGDYAGCNGIGIVREWKAGWTGKS
jgi:hypothetical protein